MSTARRERFSPAMIDVLIARAGLTLDAEQRDEILASGAALERVLTRLRADLPRSTEPAHVFSAMRFDAASADATAANGSASGSEEVVS